MLSWLHIESKISAGSLAMKKETNSQSEPSQKKKKKKKKGSKAPVTAENIRGASVLEASSKDGVPTTLHVFVDKEADPRMLCKRAKPGDRHRKIAKKKRKAAAKQADNAPSLSK